MALSPRERQILAEIEGGFTSEEERRAAAAWRRMRHTPLRVLLGLAALLGLCLFAVILFGVLLFDLGPVGLGVLTIGVVTPWLVFAFARLDRPDEH